MTVTDKGIMVNQPDGSAHGYSRHVEYFSPQTGPIESK
jgi:hypothetical protein